MIFALGAALLCAAPVSVAHRRVLASDGVALALYRYGDAGRRPVLLIPELGTTRAIFDIEGEGLARFLADHGRTVYVAEARGQGASQLRAGLGAVVTRDLPALVAATGEPRLDLVAHGFAGTLALAAAPRELQGRVGRVIALATPVLPEVPSPLVLDLLQRGGDFRGLSTEPGGARIFELVFAFNGRFRSGRLDALRAHAFGRLGPTLSAELLSWMQTGDLGLEDGSTVRARLLAYDRPTLLFCGLANGFANAEFAVPLGTVSKAQVKLRTFSRFELASEDYSHLSLVQGLGARKEVFEPALAFLDEERP